MSKKRFVWVPLCLFFLAASLQASIKILHSFAGGTSDGENPWGSLTLAGSTLYGMTLMGGTDGLGTIFKIKTNGTGFELLHSFTGSASDGYGPENSLIIIGSTLYGMTQSGGLDGDGTIFKIKTNGTGFELLHYFAGGALDGADPYGSLILSGTTLYGMTYMGGAANSGVIFSFRLK